jgi:hypothetical protein
MYSERRLAQEAGLRPHTTKPNAGRLLQRTENISSATSNLSSKNKPPTRIYAFAPLPAMPFILCHVGVERKAPASDYDVEFGEKIVAIGTTTKQDNNLKASDCKNG